MSRIERVHQARFPGCDQNTSAIRQLLQDRRRAHVHIEILTVLQIPIWTMISACPVVPPAANNPGILCNDLMPPKNSTALEVERHDRIGCRGRRRGICIPYAEINLAALGI